MVDWSKVNWKLLRDLMWAGLAAYALVVFFKLLTPPEPIAAFMGIITLVAVWTVIYNLVFARKTP